MCETVCVYVSEWERECVCVRVCVCICACSSIWVSMGVSRRGRVCDRVCVYVSVPVLQCGK